MTYIKKPKLKQFDYFNKMFHELGPFLKEYEVDKIIDFLYSVQESKFDINPSLSDSETQLKLILGDERYSEAVEEWTKHNQAVLKYYGTKKFKHKKTGQLKTQLLITDDPSDYDEYFV